MSDFGDAGLPQVQRRLSVQKVVSPPPIEARHIAVLPALPFCVYAECTDLRSLKPAANLLRHEYLAVVVPLSKLDSLPRPAAAGGGNRSQDVLAAWTVRRQGDREAPEGGRDAALRGARRQTPGGRNSPFLPPVHRPAELGIM